MTDNHTSPAALIAVDWGTSSLRAWLLDADGQVLDARRSDQGLMQVANSDFAGTYHALVHDWVRAHGRCPAIACGMIGSQGGWQEVPYIETPAAPASLAKRLVVIDTEAGAFHIVPGVMQAPAAGRLADVMRGEETQSLGALALDPTLAASARLITPGTHSKWITVEDGRLGTFATYMTGELYALLTAHSILGRPAQACAETPDPAAFDLGVATARDTGETGGMRALFSARSRWLAGELSAADTTAYLSGLLIGEELRSALSNDDHKTPICLIGDADLCARYQRALMQFDRAPARVIEDAARHGLWQIAEQAGLLTKEQL